MVKPDRRLKADIADACKHQLTLESFGVRVRIASNSASGLKKLFEIAKTAVGGKYKLLDGATAEHTLTHIRKKNSSDDLYKDGELIAGERIRDSVLRQFPTELRITVAEFARRRVFVHAGAVSWKGKGIILPAKSFQGKSTLTAELVKLGAKYFSDEYAVLDVRGRIHPFPKPLSLRGIIDELTQLDHEVEELGGSAARRPVPVRLVVLTEYKPSGKWDPKILPTGQSVFEIMRHAVPTRRYPEFTLSVLNLVSNQSKVVKTQHANAAEAARRIIESL